MARPKKFEIPEDVPVARIEEEVVEQQPAAAPDNALDIYDVDPAANQSRFRGKARAAILGVAIGLGGIAVYNLWPENNESSTGNQAVEPIVEPAPPPPVAPAPVAPTPAQPTESVTAESSLNLTPGKANWIKQNPSSPVGQKLEGAIKSQLDRLNGSFAYTIECRDGNFTGGDWMHWTSGADKPDVPNWNADIIQLGKYGQVSHPEIACAEYEPNFTGQISIVFK